MLPTYTMTQSSDYLANELYRVESIEAFWRQIDQEARGRNLLPVFVPTFDELLKALPELKEIATSPALSGGFDGIRFAQPEAAAIEGTGGLEDLGTPFLDFGFPLSTALIQSLKQGLLCYEGHIGVGTALGRVAAQTAAVGGGAAIGAMIGTAIFPGVGTIIGGALFGFFGGCLGKAAIEAEYNNAVSAYSEAQKQWLQKLESSRTIANRKLSRDFRRKQKKYLRSRGRLLKIRWLMFLYRTTVIQKRLEDWISNGRPLCPSLISFLRNRAALHLQATHESLIAEFAKRQSLLDGIWQRISGELAGELETKLRTQCLIIGAMSDDLDEKHATLKEAARRLGKSA